MVQPVQFSTNLGLSLTPEIDQKKNPDVYVEFQRIRNAIRILQSALDIYTGTLGEDPVYWNVAQARATVRVQNICRVYHIASEVIQLGQLVNFWDNAGVPTARKADADAIYPAQAFCAVADGIHAGEFGDFMLLGAMPYFTGLVTGTPLYLDTVAGQITITAPVASGVLAQQIGFVLSPDTIWFNPSGYYLVNP